MEDSLQYVVSVFEQTVMDHSAATLIQMRTALCKSTNVHDVEYFLWYMNQNMGDGLLKC